MAAPLRLGVLGHFVYRHHIHGFKNGCHCIRTLQTVAKQSHERMGSLLMNGQSSVWTENSVRPVSTFLTSKTATELWGGVTGVSNAGKKKGRGKRVGRKKVTDLNRGQVIGTGKENVLWPGLNAPVIKGRSVLSMQKLPPNPDYEKQLVKIRDEMSRISYQSPAPLLRGWSGGRYPGQSVGAPDPVADYVFHGFETKVLEFKMVTNMTGTLGRKMRFSAFVVVGNKNGLAGYGIGKAQMGRAAIRLAKNRAAQRLQYFERFDDATVFHDMYTKYHRTKIFIHKKEKGYGIHCHRALKTICELIGIKDLHCKVEGSTKNVQALTKGFFRVLADQETHQDLADRMGYHVVEFRKEKNYKPEVVATPSTQEVKKKELVDEEEDLEVAFERLYNSGKVEYKRPPKKKVYEHNYGYIRKNKVNHANRNQKAVSLLRQAGLA